MVCSKGYLWLAMLFTTRRQKMPNRKGRTSRTRRVICELDVQPVQIRAKRGCGVSLQANEQGQFDLRIPITAINQHPAATCLCRSAWEWDQASGVVTWHYFFTKAAQFLASCFHFNFGQKSKLAGLFLGSPVLLRDFWSARKMLSKSLG